MSPQGWQVWTGLAEAIQQETDLTRLCELTLQWLCEVGELSTAAIVVRAPRLLHVVGAEATLLAPWLDELLGPLALGDRTTRQFGPDSTSPDEARLLAALGCAYVLWQPLVKNAEVSGVMLVGSPQPVLARLESLVRSLATLLAHPLVRLTTEEARSRAPDRPPPRRRDPAADGPRQHGRGRSAGRSRGSLAGRE